jgi:hypothetical protein
VTLTDDEVEMQESWMRRGKSGARKQTPARILLKAASGIKDAEIMERVGEVRDRTAPQPGAPARQDNVYARKGVRALRGIPPNEARAIARKIDFHSTPKHGSWLNIAEIELAVLLNMCLSQRIPDEETLRKHITANDNERNAKRSSIKWKFATQDARRKLHRLYPRVSA